MTMQKFLIVTALALTAGTALAQPAPDKDGPSFNCNYAKTPDEILICQHPGLAEKDVQLANFFYQLRNQMPDRMRRRFDADQAVWLRRRRECGRDPACIEKAYDARMRELGRFCDRYDCTL
jgi:uncharacterized protein